MLQMLMQTIGNVTNAISKRIRENRSNFYILKLKMQKIFFFN